MFWDLHLEKTIRTLHDKNYHVFLKLASIQRVLLSQGKRAGGWIYQQHPDWHCTTHLLEYKQCILEMCLSLFIQTDFRPYSWHLYIYGRSKSHINVHKYLIIAKFLGAKPISGLLECFCMEQDHSQAPIDSTSHLSKGEGLHFRHQTGKT